MKKENKIFLSILSVLAALGIFVWGYIQNNHHNLIYSIYSYITQYPPIKWNGVYIDYKYGMHVSTYNSSISIQYYGRENEESLGVFMEDDPVLDNYTKRNYSGTGFTFISGKFNEYNGHKVYTEELIKDSNKRYMKIYHILDLPIALGYAGPTERLPEYQYVIDSIFTLNANVNN